jgi:hypothetical protein
MKKIIQLLFIALFYSCTTALAAETPLIIRNSLDKQFLVGSATLKFLGMKVYDISLWSEVPKFSYEKSFAIHIKYNMNFSRDELAKRSITEIERLHKLSEKDKKIYLNNLNLILHSVKKGDEKVAIFIPSKGVKMFHNNEETGAISDLKLSRLFVDIWLDEKGSYPEVTRQVLGKPNL